MTAGTGVYRTQPYDIVLPNADRQVWGAAWILKGFIQSLGGYPTVHITKGQHDASFGRDEASTLVIMLRLMGINAKYEGDEFILNCGTEDDPHNIMFEHGYGYSSYYPFSYALIRNTRSKLLNYGTLGMEGKERIRRCCFGHSHWLMIGYGVTVETYFDCTGGFQRNERTVLGGRGTIRPVGAIIYDYSAIKCAMRVLEIVPERESLRSDIFSKKLRIESTRDANEALDAVTDWALAEGIVSNEV